MIIKKYKYIFRKTIDQKIANITCSILEEKINNSKYVL